MPDVAPTVLNRHVAIYRAIACRRPGAARKAMRLHLEETIKLVTHVIEQKKSEKKGNAKR
jgi:DNA-binding FadR family transcriptional regulator